MNGLEAMTNNDYAMLKDPDRWPNWPVLPVIRRQAGQGTEVAVVSEIGTTGRLYIRRGANLFDRSNWPDPEEATAEDIIQEGWTVD